LVMPRKSGRLGGLAGSVVEYVTITISLGIFHPGKCPQKS
jgi:hypothetical protein